MTDQLATTESYIGYIERLCSRADLRSWTAYNHLDELTSTRLRQAREIERLITSIIGQKSEENRRKRGSFDFVGKVSMILYGTMDGDGAQYYNDQTEHFEQNSNSLTHLLEQQLTTVRSTLGAINETLSDVTYNESKMRDGLLQLQCYVGSITAQYGNMTNMLSVKITLESHIGWLLDGLNVLRHLDIILGSLVDAQQGILHPQVIPPHLIIDALVRDSPYFPPNTSPLITLSKDSAH
jgi:hypothetical protein